MKSEIKAKEDTIREKQVLSTVVVIKAPVASYRGHSKQWEKITAKYFVM